VKSSFPCEILIPLWNPHSPVKVLFPCGILITLCPQTYLNTYAILRLNTKVVSSIGVSIYECMYIHTLTRTHNSRSHTHALKHPHTWKHVYTRRIQTRTYARTHTHARTHAHTHTRTHARAHTHTHTLTHTRTRAHTHTHTCSHTHTHTLPTPTCLTFFFPAAAFAFLALSFADLAALATSYVKRNCMYNMMRLCMIKVCVCVCVCVCERACVCVCMCVYECSSKRTCDCMLRNA
jgi:hypothetical protein